MLFSSSLKRVLVSASFSVVSLVAAAQPNKPYELMVQGVKVIVQPSGNEIIDIKTIIKGGVQNYASGKDGIESLAIVALTECGTEKDSKNSFKNKLDKVSAQVYGYSDLDYATFTLNCIKSDFDIVWPLYVDALTIPKFEPKEFDRIKRAQITLIKDQTSIPEYGIANFARQTAFAGKDYAKLPEGNEETISKLTVEETKSYYKNIFTKSRIFFVVVGEIERADLEKKITDLLSVIPAGKPVTLKKEAFVPKTNSFKSEKKEFPINYLQGVGGAPLPGSADDNAFALAMRIFQNRQSLEVTSKNNLAPNTYSYIAQGLSPSSNIFVSTTEPNKYIGVINDVISATKKEGFTEEEVKNIKTSYLTAYYYKLETNSAQAWSLAFDEAVQNNWRRSITLNDDIKALKVNDLNKAFNKYLTNLTWIYQGDPGKVDSKLYLQKIDNKAKLPPSKLDIKTKK